MAERLLKYYKYTSELMGVDGKMKLAIETKISSISAATAPDSAENLALFKKAVENITKKPAPSF